MDKNKIEIYSRQFGTEIRYVSLPYFDDENIAVLKKLRFQKVDKEPQISQGVKGVREIGMKELIIPLKNKIIQMLDDPAWVVILFEAIQKEAHSPSMPKKQ